MRACTLVKCVYLKNVGMNWSKKMTAPKSLSEVAWNWKAYNKLSKKKLHTKFKYKVSNIFRTFHTCYSIMFSEYFPSWLSFQFSLIVRVFIWLFQQMDFLQRIELDKGENDFFSCEMHTEWVYIFFEFVARKHKSKQKAKYIANDNSQFLECGAILHPYTLSICV